MKAAEDRIGPVDMHRTIIGRAGRALQYAFEKFGQGGESWPPSGDDDVV
jgi:hypothetical protein